MSGHRISSDQSCQSYQICKYFILSVLCYYLIYLFKLTYQLLSLISHVFEDSFVAKYREYISGQPVEIIRELVIHLMHIITDLTSLPSHLLETGTPSISLLSEALVDFLYGGSFFRPSGKYFYFILFSASTFLILSNQISLHALNSNLRFRLG